MENLLQGVVLGVHLLSAHFPNEGNPNNVNPGIYVRTDAGWTAGVLRNTLRRTAVYGGFTFTTEAVSEDLPLSLTVGAISGYKKQRNVPRPCSESPNFNNGYYTDCTYSVGSAKTYLIPMLVPSAAVRLGGDVSARLSLLKPRGSRTALHLSLEAGF